MSSQLFGASEWPYICHLGVPPTRMTHQAVTKVLAYRLFTESAMLQRRESDGWPVLSTERSGNTKAAVPKQARPGPGPGLRSRMTYPHTLQDTGKRFGATEERWARSYTRPNTWKTFRCRDMFFMPRGGPICGVLGFPVNFPPTRVAHHRA